MDEQEMPMDEDYGEWAYQLELEQQYFEEKTLCHFKEQNERKQN